MLEFLNKYFIVLSATAAVAASVFSMVFLTSYLAVFDWSLVWLIESSDVAKFGLMAVAIVSPLLATLSNNLNAFHGWFAQKQKGYLWVILILVALIVAGSASNIYHDIKQQTGQGTYHLMYGLSSLGVLGIMWLTFSAWDALREPRWPSTSFYLLATALGLGFFGATYGYYVKDANKQMSDIMTKNETFKNAKIVMMLSHHIVFFAEGKVTTIPTADVIKIVTAAPPNALLP